MAVRKKGTSESSDPINLTLSEESTETSPADGGVARRPRRRRTNTSNTSIGETAALVAALLRTRGAQGAVQEDLQNVVAWARGVRDEGESLQSLASRPRRQKSQAPIERVTRYEMNRALLDGILSGSIALDVQEGSGTLLFLDGQHLAARQAISEPEAEATKASNWVTVEPETASVPEENSDADGNRDGEV